MSKARPIKRVLIANRGEIALRAVRVCKRLGLDTVAVYSRADAASPHVWAADDAVCIGPPPATQSYLAAKSLIHVALEKGCDAVYPGYGFLAENAEFADLCAENGIKFVGPSADHIRMMGDKSKAREVAITYGVPVVPGSDAAYTTLADAQPKAADVGYPMLLKARAGGGGRGMRIVAKPEDFAPSFAEANREAEAAFGDGALYIERFFKSVRHIEVQVFGDGKGGAIAFDERDCSVQRRHQKLIEESPSPAVDEPLRARLKEAALLLTQGIKYEGAGTIEFIMDPSTNEFFFIEMNTRIQVEHTVTEMRIGKDLVEWQFDIAAGKLACLKDHDLPAQGHAIEFRINVEDWRNGFAPAPGRLNTWRFPKGDGIRLDSAAYEGQLISPFYDSMIAKLIVLGTDRADALAKSRKVLDNFEVGGVKTTIGFHRLLIDHDDFLSDRVHTRWIETEMDMDAIGEMA
jgi:acetyl-CoA carboxylase, biotin carboxylase subunit